MFSGIVETIGYINQIVSTSDCLHVRIAPVLPFLDIKIGDSIAVNGVCLTVTECSENTFDVTIVPETLRQTNLASLSMGSMVNLERSVKVGDRISGHYVQGHVDDVGIIKDISFDGEEALLLQIEVPERLAKYIVRKGYITLDGMSLTIIDIDLTCCTLTIIPHTKAVTIAKNYRVGDKVNIEVDILSKYVEKLVERG